jgi:hypothetical protein
MDTQGNQNRWRGLDNTTWYAINSLLAQISQFAKSGPGATFDGLNKQRRNGFLQWAEMP